MKHYLVLILLGAVNFAAYQNCSSQGQGNTSTAAANAAGGATAASAISVTATNYTIGQNQSQQVVASGGTAPYVYSLLSGSGTIDGSTGWFTANSTTGAVVIQATDAKGLKGQIALSVTTASGSTTTGTDNTTSSYSCDDVVPVSFGQSCYGAKDSSCTTQVSYFSSIPSGCKVAKVNVYARHFSGMGSCSADASLSFTSSGTQGSGQQAAKTAYLSVTADLSSSTLSFTDTASGWGSCGGNPCNPCVSDIHVELSLQSL